MIFRFIVTVVIVYLLYRVVKGLLRFPARQRDPIFHRGSASTIQGGDLVQDPYCLTYIPEKDAYKMIIGGKTLFFCSQECSSKYALEHKKQS